MLATVETPAAPATYGLPAGSNITYGSPGFPPWVYALAKAFNLQASTYPGTRNPSALRLVSHPTRSYSTGASTGPAPSPDMQRFAEYLLSIKGSLEQVIWENPNTGQRVGVAGGDDVTTAPYYADDYGNHTDHVHTRQSAPIPLPGGAAAVADPRPDFNEYAVWSSSNQDRVGTKIDLFLLHTQKAPGTPTASHDSSPTLPIR